MASSHLTASSISTRNVASFQGLRPSEVQFHGARNVRIGNSARRSFKGVVVKAATVVAPKYTTIKPLGDKILVKVKEAEEKMEERGFAQKKLTIRLALFLSESEGDSSSLLSIFIDPLQPSFNHSFPIFTFNSCTLSSLNRAESS
ncbi:hypothetical protein RYX36_020469 [Vicia faba]